MADQPATPRRSLGAHSLAYVVGTAIQGVGVLLVVPFATRVLGVVEFGRVATALVAVQLVGTIAAAGLPQVVLREHHRGSDGPRAARALAGAMVAGAVGLGLVGVLVVLGLGATGWVDAATWLPVAVAAAALTVVVSGQTLARARLRPLSFLLLAIASTVLAQLAGLLAARSNPTAPAFLTAYAVALAAAAVLALGVGRPLPPWAAPDRVRAGVRLAAPLLPQAAAMLGLLMGDVLLVRMLLGEAAAGGYQVALQLGNMPFVLAVAFFNAWSPLVLSHPTGERWRWTARTGTALAAVVTIGAGGVAALAPWLVGVLAGADFDRAPIAAAVAVITLTSGVYLVYLGSSLAVLDAERTGLLAWASVTALAVLVALSAWWAPQAGPDGLLAVAGAKAVAYAVLMGLTVWAGGRLSSLRWPARLWLLLTGLAVVALACASAADTPVADTARLGLAAALAVGAALLVPRIGRALRG